MSAMSNEVVNTAEARWMARIEAAIFNTTRPALAVVRTFERECVDCGTVLVWSGTDARWVDRAITFDDTHDCGGDCE